MFAAVCAAAMLTGCKPEVLPGTDGPDEVKIDDSVLKLESFSFLKSVNSSLKDDVTTVISQACVDDGAGIPYYVNPRALVASFDVFACESVSDVEVSAGVQGGRNIQDACKRQDCGGLYAPCDHKAVGGDGRQTYLP